LQLDKEVYVKVTSAGEDPMAKEKIVRCTVSPRGGKTGQSTARYVPLEIFELWRHLMTRRHGFEVNDDCTSLWFDIDGDPHVNYSDSNYEKVVRISLWIYSEEDGMFTRVTRYFPLEAYPDIKPRFLAHYAEYFDSSPFPPRLDETYGVWLKPVDS
jgi:hypothetical protein